ncbi:uncharacterized protein A4U43_C08F24610 [Asparagus officinalis]|nr:uncharacterized protein A4U43_C08F24610 [Asparagus officinalis]
MGLIFVASASIFVCYYKKFPFWILKLIYGPLHLLHAMNLERLIFCGVHLIAFLFLYSIVLRLELYFFDNPLPPVDILGFFLLFLPIILKDGIFLAAQLSQMCEISDIIVGKLN